MKAAVAPGDCRGGSGQQPPTALRRSPAPLYEP